MAPEVLQDVDAVGTAIENNEPDTAAIAAEAAAAAEEAGFVADWSSSSVHLTDRHRFRYVIAPSGYLVRPDSYVGPDFEVAALEDIAAFQPGGAS